MKMLKIKLIKSRSLIKLMLIMCLSSCVTTNYKTAKIVLPEMPLAGEEVLNELEIYCKDYKKCPHTLEWLNKLYWFKMEYTAYQEELQK